MEETNEIQSIEMTDTDSENLIKVYTKRWYMLVIFCFGSITNAIIWNTFSSINTPTQTYYGVSNVFVDMLSLTFLIMYIPFSIACNFISLNYNSRIVFSIGAILNFLSTFLRFFSVKNISNLKSPYGYSILLSGQIIGAMAQPFFTNMPALVTANWFPLKERDLATSLSSLSNLLGIAFASIISGIFTSSNSKSVNMFMLLLVQLIISTVSSLLILLFYKNKPPLPPSYSEMNKHSPQRFTDTLKAIFRNKNYLILFVCFGLGLGFFNAFTTLVEQLVKKSNYTSNDASLFSALFISCGIVSAIIIGIILDRTHKYFLILKTFFVLSLVAIMSVILVIRPNQKILVAIFFGILGFAMLPLLPVTFECAIELTYPIHEDISIGFLMSAGQITGIGFILGLQYLINAQPTYSGSYKFVNTYIFITCFAFFFCLGILFLKGQFLRLNAEKLNLSNE